MAWLTRSGAMLALVLAGPFGVLDRRARGRVLDRRGHLRRELFLPQGRARGPDGQVCGTGDQSLGDTSGCHATVTHFRLNVSNTTPVPCNGLTPTGAISTASQANYQAAQGEMTLDYPNAPLIAWPTQKFQGHPRQIFKPDSDEYNLIKDWATKYASH